MSRYVVPRRLEPRAHCRLYAGRGSGRTLLGPASYRPGLRGRRRQHRGRSRPARRRQPQPRHELAASLVNRSYVLDLLPGNSFIEQWRDAGFDVFLLDWGVADDRDAGNTLEDYVDAYLPAALARACRVSGARHLNLVGYCFGGAE